MERDDDLLEWSDADFGVLTESDMAMVRHALTPGPARDVDYSEFMLDDE